MTGSSVLQGNKQHPHTEHEQYDEQVQKACPAIEQQFHNFAHPEYPSLNVSKTILVAVHHGGHVSPGSSNVVND